MSEGNRTRSLIGIAVAGVARAPLRSKLALLANVVLILGVTAFALMDNDGGADMALDGIAMALFMSGALLLSVASVLWTLSQDGKCGFFDIKREALRLRGLRTRRLDEVLVAFPVFAFASGCLMAAGIAIWATVLTNPVSRWLIGGMAVWFFVWTVSMIASTTRFMYSHAREQAEAAERARGEAAESQLAALQAQMNPHFLFNTLNTVASLVRTDAAAAEATVENLAVVLRRTLDRSRRVLSTVDDEVEHLAAYISVAKQRFEDRLQVHWSIDPRARDVLVPTMTLQPLVENALKHGIGARLEGGALHIGVALEDASEAPSGGPACAEADEERPAGVAGSSSPIGRGAGGAAHAPGAGGRLVIEVADDGPGFRRRHVEATGLTNLRTRLATLYGDAAELRIERVDPGARVVVIVPDVRVAEDLLGVGSLGGRAARKQSGSAAARRTAGAPAE